VCVQRWQDFTGQEATLEGANGRKEYEDDNGKREQAESSQHQAEA